MNYGTSIHVGSYGSPRPSAPKVVPVKALVISSIEGTQRSVLTVHSIRGLKLSEGSVVDQTAVPEIVGSLGLLGGIGWCDDTILACGAAGVVWYRKAAVRPMNWNVNGQHITRRVRWPTLVFRMGFAGTFHVWAVAGDGRPAASAPLYHAPLANIYDNATMCWGTVPVPAFTMESIPAFEAAVFDTFFTKANHGRVLASEDRDDLQSAWKRAGTKGLSAKQMSPFGRTLEAILNEPSAR